MVTVLDGGMGRELQRSGAPFRQPEWSALALIEAPKAVAAVHRAYCQAGAEVITTNSYALVPFHIGDARFANAGLELAKRAGSVARAAAQDFSGVRVAGSLPPVCGSYRPDLFDAAVAAPLLAVLIEGLAPHVDLWLAETLSALDEARAVIAQLAGDPRPLWLSFTLADGVGDRALPGQLRSGEDVEAVVQLAAGCGAQALLFNCSQPEVMEGAVERARNEALRLRAALQIGVYANAFPPQSDDATANDTLLPLRDDLDPPGYMNWVKRWIAAGAVIVGGCCGIGPEHIVEIAAQMKDA